MQSLTQLSSRRLVLLLAVFGLVLFTACGGDDGEQVLHLSMNSEPGTIDPHMTSVSNEVSIARQLSSGLYTYNEQLEVVPALAAAMPSISEDGMTYTVDLRESTWSDGDDLTADDFVYSTLRVLDPNFASPSAWVFYDIAGAFAYNTSLEPEEGAPAPPASEVEQLRSLVGVKAEDDDTLVYTLEAPNPSFLNVLAHIAAVPVKQSVVEEHGDAWTDPANFVGNGPFVLTSWARGSEIILSKNDNWYGPEPSLSSISVTFISDDIGAYNAYATDADDSLDAVRAPAATLAGNERSDELVQTPSLTTYALFMNNAAEPFDNALVRQAFGSAIDRDAYVTAVLQGGGAPTTSWVPPGMPGYNAELGTGLSFDPERASDLLAEAGFEGGEGLPEIQLIMIASDYNNLVGQFIEEQLETNLGVDVTVEFYDQGQYFDELFSGNYDATIQSWTADWPAADNFLGLFHSQGDANFSFYANPDFDELLEEAAVAPNASTRVGLYDQAQKILLEDAGLAPLYNEIDNTYVKPSVLDLIITGIDGALKGDLFFWKTKID